MKGKILTIKEVLDLPDGTKLHIDCGKYGSENGELSKHLDNPFPSIVVGCYGLSLYLHNKTENYPDIPINKLYDGEDCYVTIKEII